MPKEYIVRLVMDRKYVVFGRLVEGLKVISVVVITGCGAYKNAEHENQNTCRTDRAGIISGASWISVPYPFHWGAPTFDAGEAFAMMADSFVAQIESTGGFIAVARLAEI